MNFFKKNYKTLVFTGIIVLCLVMMFVALLLTTHFTEVLREQVETRVLLYTNKNIDLLSDKIRAYEYRTEYASKLFADSEDLADYLRIVEKLRYDPDFEDLMAVRYFKDGKEFATDGSEYAYEEDPVIRKFAESDRTGCTGVVYSREHNMRLVAFCEKVEDCYFMDKVFIFYPLTAIRDFSDGSDMSLIEKSQFVAFCSSDGQSLGMISNESEIVQSNANIFDEIHRLTNSKDTVDALKTIVSEETSGVQHVRINGEEHIIVVAGAKGCPEFCTIGLYRSIDVYTTGYQFINTILTTIVVIFIIMVFLGGYFLATNQSLKRTIYNFGTVDPNLGCPTVVKFERTVPEYLDRYRGSQFVVVVAGVKHFSYITETYGSQAADDVLKYMNFAFSKALQAGEIYAFISESNFVFMLHYRETEILLNRLRTLYTLVFENSSTKRYNVKLDFGIYKIDRNGEKNVRKMIDKAIVARDTEIPGMTPTNYRFYQENFLDNYMQNADVEVKMDSALENNEFRVFFQPKYNIKYDRIDGCEALVRWYDSEKDQYRPPATFLPLFETNGFIQKLDNYVYYKVCEFLSRRAASGQKIYPTSVNISRITVQDPGFLDYYVSIKKKFKIPDNFIMLEFTESVAYENYETLNKLVTELHKEGFLCSIDDFGTGYSSYNILKVMIMDEIKLDKFFIDKGISSRRDKLIIESVIKIAKDLNMKVTQEGVETKDTVEYLRSVGCDVVQGYYFSKPLSLPDYEKFIDAHEEETHQASVSE